MSFKATGRATSETQNQTGVPEHTATKEQLVLPESTAVATTTTSYDETAGLTDQETFEIAHDVLDIFGEMSAERLEKLCYVKITDPVTKRDLLFTPKYATTLAELVEKDEKQEVSKLIRSKFM